MKLHFIHLPGLFLILMLSCSQPQSKAPLLQPEAVFTRSDTLHGTYLQNPLNPCRYAKLSFTKYGILCETAVAKDNYLFHLVDSLNANLICAGGHKGRGPGEFLMVRGGGYDGKTGYFYAMDQMKNFISKMSVGRDSIKYISSFVFPEDLYEAFYINDSIFAVLTFLPDQSICIMDSKGNYLDKQPNKILDDPALDYKKIYFNTRIKVTPDRSRIIAVDYNYNIIKIYSIRDNRLYPEQDIRYFPVEWKAVNGRPVPEPTHVRGGGWLEVSDRYIYIVTLGQTQEEFMLEKRHNISYLLIFDIKGNFVKSYTLDHDVSGFTIVRDRYLYGTVIDPDGETRIIKYDLDVKDR